MTFLERASNSRKLVYKDWIETKDELERRAQQGKDADKIRKLLAAFKEFDPEPGILKTETVGSLVWELHQAGPLMRGFHADEVVAQIRKLENHKQVNGEVEVYELTVGANTLPERIHRIADARALGSRLYAERMGKTE